MSTKSVAAEVRDVANDLHRRNGEPDGYEGPCWGPTQAEIAEAQTIVVRRRAGLRRGV